MDQPHRWDIEPGRYARWWARHATAITVAYLLTIIGALALAVDAWTSDQRQQAAVFSLVALSASLSLPMARGIAENVRDYDRRNHTQP